MHLCLWQRRAHHPAETMGVSISRLPNPQPAWARRRNMTWWLKSTEARANQTKDRALMTWAPDR